MGFDAPESLLLEEKVLSEAKRMRWRLHERSQCRPLISRLRRQLPPRGKPQVVLSRTEL